MAEPLIMPKLDMTMVEGTLGRWYKSEGDVVAKGDLLFEVEADKATIDIDAPADGILRGVTAQQGARLAVGTVLGYIVDPNENWEPPAAQPAPAPAEAPKVAAPAPPVTQAASLGAPAPTVAPAATAGALPSDSRPYATPAAKRLATELGIDLTALSGTGVGGMVQAADVQAAHQSEPAGPRATPLARKASAADGIALAAIEGSGVGGKITLADVKAAATRPVASTAAPERVTLTGVRAVIAKRMVESYQSSPHVTLSLEVDMAEAARLRARLLKSAGVKISYTALISFLTAKALRAFPAVNATWDGDDALLRHHEVHLAIAVDAPQGLMVPVVRNADAMGLEALSQNIASQVELTRTGKLPLADLAGGTFTISNLGSFGIEVFTPIINPPQVAILGVGALVDKVVPLDGVPTVRPRMTLSLSFDHRALDGADAARFLARLRELLETPETALL